MVVLNPKGGSGKTTLAFNLAGYLASTGRRVAMVDMDRQGSSTHWLRNRSAEQAPIHGIAASYNGGDAREEQRVAVPDDIEYLVVDAPAGLPGESLIDFTCGAHAIIVPVLPSDLDIHAATKLISSLLLQAQVSRRNGRLGVVANRVRERTIAYRQLRRFLDRLSITVIGHLRDSQNYTRAASNGLCIHEMRRSMAGKDQAQWEAVTRWLEDRLAMPLTSRDMLRPATAERHRPRRRPASAVLIRSAAAAVLVALSFWLGSAARGPAEPESVEQISELAGDNLEPLVPALRKPSIRSLQASAGARLQEKWQLNGIASWGGSSVLILEDRQDNSIRRINGDVELDGWSVSDFGSDYAVFAQNGEEVRLVLNEDSGR